MRCKTCGQDIPSKAAPMVDQGFDLFWSVYPRKVGKKTAQKAWMRAVRTDAMLDRVMRALAWQTSYLWDDQRYIPHPTSWLNQERWMDEPPKDILELMGRKEIGPMLYPIKGELDAGDQHEGRKGLSTEGSDR